MAEKIHSLYPEPLVLKSLKAAMQYGSLEMVQWFIENRHDRLCCPAGAENFKRRTTLSSGFSSFEQFRNTATLPVSTGFQELTRWVHETGRLARVDAESVLECAISPSSLEVIRYLLEHGFTLTGERLKGVLIPASLREDAPTRSIVEYVVGSPLCDPFRDQFKYAPARPSGAPFVQWQWSQLNYPETRLYTRCCEGFQWFVQEHPDFSERMNTLADYTEDELLDVFAWRQANNCGGWSSNDLCIAASRGFLLATQWLHFHRSESYNVSAMDEASENGHLHVVKWLHANRTEDCTEAAMTGAATNGHLAVVQWLHANRTEGKATLAMAGAAVEGQLDVLTWLHENTDDGCTCCVLQALLWKPLNLRMSLGDWGAAERLRNEPGESFSVLNTLRWLGSMHIEQTCRRRCLPVRWLIHWQPISLFGVAIETADIQLLDYVDAHHRDISARDFQSTGNFDSVIKSSHSSISSGSASDSGSQPSVINGSVLLRVGNNPSHISVII